MSDAGDQDRPSFTDYWRRQNEGKPLVFVSQEPQPAEDTAPEQTAQEKAQRRRAQVRKAQLQHRERKADYIKKLELDVTQIRNATEQVERRCEVLRKENDEMRMMLAQIGGASVLPSAVENQVPVHQLQLEHQVRQSGEELLVRSAAPTQAVTASLSVDKRVTLGMDEVMQQPCYKIIPSPSGGEMGSDKPPVDEDDLAINFILALEHICWDHFHPSDFEVPDHEELVKETGHTLMASTFCAATAPEVLYPRQKGGNVPPKGESPSWTISGLTLQNLRLLASSLIPGDAELTPVQGWFELVERYGTEVLLGQAMASLKREFVGVVKCPHFGAVIEREAFESVVERVMGDYSLLPSLEEGEVDSFGRG